jgi:hypothetical protein
MMSIANQDNLQREIQAKLREMPPADWVRQMIDHYRRTGTYRAKDLRKLLGDPNRAVEVGTDTCLSSFFSN